jgi:hypothetical protein
MCWGGVRDILVFCQVRGTTRYTRWQLVFRPNGDYCSTSRIKGMEKGGDRGGRRGDEETRRRGGGDEEEEKEKKKEGEK